MNKPLIAFVLGCLTSMPAQAQRAAERLMPPAGLACDRNHLTSYNGTLAAYEASDTAIRIEIATDWNTREQVDILLSPDQGPERSFLLHGHPFSPGDWSFIEAAPGQREPAPDTRLIAWVCEDGVTPARIDWRPRSSR